MNRRTYNSTPIEDAAFLQRAVSQARCLLWQATVLELPCDRNHNPLQPSFNEELDTYLHWNLRLIAPHAVLEWLPFPFTEEQPLQEAFLHARCPEEQYQCEIKAIQALRDEVPRYHQEYTIQLENGSVRWLNEDVTVQCLVPGCWNLVGVCTDITDRKEIEARLAYQAQHDPLTGLANRRQLMETIEKLLAKPHGHTCLFFVDLDNFKLINDNFGHHSGDQVLIATAERLRREVGLQGVIARLGGDEFTVLLPDVPSSAHVNSLAERLTRALNAPLVIQERPLLLSASIGVALGEPGSTSDLLRNANTAMHHAKGLGKAGYLFFDPIMDQDSRERFELEAALRRALRDGEIKPYYQPILSLKTGAVVAVEALARWQTSEGTYLPPGRFIPIAEETGLIIPLGAALLRAACCDAVRWRGVLANRSIHVNVNVSERQFREEDFVPMVRQTLQETGLPPTALTLELTESILLSDIESGIARLHELEELGVRLSLDDFGTGYCSLSYLSRLPVKALKVDRSFVSALSHADPKLVTQNEAIIRTILALAQTLELSVTAEGIEEVSQQKRLTALGASFGQGYLFARPMPAHELSRYLAAEATPQQKAA
ncbi:EAL domain-containing protein [Armatimonas sp.]|uniref:sensor domain-containing protein n=1 Tax=Armatimonas sp. TaxID=1872638 RepID=UPI003753D861